MRYVDMAESSRVLLLIAGTFWGFWYIGLSQIGWGEPGTQDYQPYELYNRLMPVVVGLLAAATYVAHQHLRDHYARANYLGVYTALLGLFTMVVSNVLEFWIFTLTPYASGSLRGTGWGIYCAGLLLFYIGSAMFGFVLLRLPKLRLPGVLMLTWLPTGAVLFALDPSFGTGQLGFAGAAAISGVSYVVLGLRLPIARPTDRQS